jgi:TPP-dependent pyruvate/acetoin dehydrogenase alpha subunit
MEGPMPMGVCDGRGMTGCRLWAEENASGAPAMAICIQAGTGGCARADACTDARDVSTCTCGDGPACDPGEVCTLDAVTGRGACTCVTRTGP